ncbi:TetR family transcriptional regulator C-terminal domain-containing protein [Occultella kanbiaonis]|uniref:TetR family transcriptional regulator C-terminal domain-containing protein n=1 Tax=Occultella kanbiaonis TaxID=2675754 RepID=UPI001F370A1B|nr:TetR/AcrR family transcriptional regulator [Occultella kanbiaonis]
MFGSKENLQLAVVSEAKRIFIDVVVQPARTEAAGFDRLCALVRTWIDYSSGRTFRGGCFFLAASAEFAAHPGAVRDAITEAMDLWRSYLEHQISRAIADGALPRLDDATQLGFELEALLSHANAESTLHDRSEPYRRAERAIVERLEALGGDQRVLNRVRAP